MRCDAAAPSYALTTQSRQLLVPENLSFDDQSLEWQSRKISQEVKDANSQLEGLHGKLQMVAAFMAFRNRNLVASLEHLKEEYYRLIGQEYEKYVPTDPDDVMAKVYAPKPAPEKKRADRFIQAEVKDLYRRISSKCHPDRTTDKNLHDFMPFANSLYENAELEMLREIWKAVNDYVASKKKRNLKQFFKARIAGVRNMLNALKEQLESARQTREYDMVVAYEEKDYDHASRIYQNLIEEQMMDVRVKLAQLKGSRRMADGYRSNNSWTTGASTGWFDNV